MKNACFECINCKAGALWACVRPVKKKKALSAETASVSFFPSQQSAFKETSKCAHSHPGLKITDSITVYGGQASAPIKKDCDIYVSLDKYSTVPFNAYPWEDGPKPVMFTYPISDMQAPTDAASFKRMIGWLVAQAQAGKVIHVGCQGGHGRTGMVLSALVKEITGNADAIEFVRKNYCGKAVETAAQVKWLGTHFGINPVKGAKEWGGSTSTYKGWDDDKSYGVMGRLYKESKSKTGNAASFNEKYSTASNDVIHQITPMATGGNIWGIKGH